MKKIEKLAVSEKVNKHVTVINCDTVKKYAHIIAIDDVVVIDISDHYGSESKFYILNINGDAFS